jgi:hypothetical protein
MAGKTRWHKVRKPRAVFACGLAAIALLITLGACGTDPVGVDSCRTIEQARCENAPRCGIDLTYPVHRGDSQARNVSECIRYYHDACLHGLVASVDPGQTSVQVCVDAINNGDCTVVTNPETAPACAFLDSTNGS